MKNYGRWYVEPGLTSLSYSGLDGFFIGYGLKAGLRIKSKTFGVIDVYAIGLKIKD